MPVKIRRTGSKAASSTNIVNKIHLAALTANPVDKDNEKHLKRRTMSSQAIHQHQPSALIKTASQAKLHGNKTNGKHENHQKVGQVGSAHTADDDDWVSSSSAMASPAPEPNTEEEDEPIYVNPNLNGRYSHHQTFPATPKRSNQQGLPHQRHHISDHATKLDPKIDLVPVTAAEYTRGIHPDPTVAAIAHLPQNQPFTEPNHIRFAGAPAHDDYHFNAPDPRIHHHGAAHHASPPPVVNPIGAATEEEGESDQPSTSVIRITEPPVSALKSQMANTTNQVQNDEKQRDDGKRSRRTSAKLRQDQIDAFVGQIAPTNTIRSAVSGNGAGASDHIGQEVGRTSQRGLGAASVQTTEPLTPVAPDASNSQPPPVGRNRPSILRRDTTPTAMSRSPIPVDTLPRSQTPPATMTHDEMVALNHKRHSVHSAGGNRRPLSLFQPSLSTKRHSIAQHGHPTPLSLLVRMNTTSQGGNHAPAAPPAISPSYDKDGDAGYVSMSPTRSRAGQSLRRRGSVASLSSIATAPVTTSTSSATAQGAAASPTSALPTTSSALLHNLTARPTKHLSMTSRHDVRPEIRRTSQLYYKSDESPLFVSQFCAKKDPRSDREDGSRSLGEEMAGPEDWSSHLTIMRHRHPMLESMHRISAAKAEASRLK